MDSRKLERRRIRGVQLILAGKSQREIARKFRLSPSSVNEWMQRYRKKGWDGLEPAKPHGPPVTFLPQYRKLLRRLVLHNPQQHGFAQDCWTVAMLRSVVNRKTGESFSNTTILRYLHKAGMSFQKPKKVAYERDQHAEELWFKKQLPSLIKEAKRRGARIFFEDESGFELEATRGGTWAPVGKTPVIRRSGKRMKVTVAGAVSDKGDLHLKKYRKRGMNGKRYAAFLESLKKSTVGQSWLSMMGFQPTGQKRQRRWLVNGETE